MKSTNAILQRLSKAAAAWQQKMTEAAHAQKAFYSEFAPKSMGDRLSKTCRCIFSDVYFFVVFHERFSVGHLTVVACFQTTNYASPVIVLTRFCICVIECCTGACECGTLHQQM